MVTTDPGWDVHVGFVALVVSSCNVNSAICCGLACIWLGLEWCGHLFSLSDSPCVLLSLLALFFNSIHAFERTDVAMYLCALWTCLGTLLWWVSGTLLGVAFLLGMHL